MDSRSYSEPYLSRRLSSRTVSLYSLYKPASESVCTNDLDTDMSPALHIPVEVAELVVNSLDDPDYAALWRNWRLVSRSFRAAVESAFARHHLQHVSARIVLDNPPATLYFRLYDVSTYDTLATFRVCRYGPPSNLRRAEGEQPLWGMSEAMWERTTMRGWQKRWQSVTPRWPFNMAVVELGKQQKFMELPALTINPTDIAFQCDWRCLLSRFFNKYTPSVISKGSRVSASSCLRNLRVNNVDERGNVAMHIRPPKLNCAIEQVEEVY